MRLASAAVAVLLMISASLPVQATTDVTVTLTVKATITAPFNEPTFTTHCSVTVPAGSSAADVLDQAVMDGCVADWDAIDYGGSLGRYLTGITKTSSSDSTDARNADTIRFVCGALATHPGGALLYSFWGFAVDGNAPSVGVDNYAVTSGEDVQFHYIVDACPSALYETFLLAGAWPESLIELQGNAMTEIAGGVVV